jgi:hypothetical protein
MRKKGSEDPRLKDAYNILKETIQEIVKEMVVL